MPSQWESVPATTHSREPGLLQPQAVGLPWPPVAAGQVCKSPTSSEGTTRRVLRTVSFALLATFLLILGVNVFCLGDPVQVALEILFQLLLFPELLEISPSFCLFSFL